MNIDEKIRLICRHEYQSFFRYPNVVGVALGYKVIDNKKTNIKCIHVYVKEKLIGLPKEMTIPKLYKGINTDVIETGEIKALGSPNVASGAIGASDPKAFTSKIRPVKFGYSIGSSSDNSTGTAGCLVVGTNTGVTRFYILTCGHIIAQAASVIQPGPAHGGTAADVIGYVKDYSRLRYDLDPKCPNIADAAIISITDTAVAPADNFNTVTPEIAFMPKPLGTDLAALGDEVQKSGAGTGYTRGTVQGVWATMTITIDAQHQALFINQIVLDPIASGADAGAAILNMENSIVGMAIAASGTSVVCNTIGIALSSMGCELFV